MIRALAKPLAIACLIGALIVLTYSFLQLTRSSEYFVCEVPNTSDSYQSLQFQLLDQHSTLVVKNFTPVELVVDIIFISLAWCGALYFIYRLVRWFRVTRWKSIG